MFLAVLRMFQECKEKRNGDRTEGRKGGREEESTAKGKGKRDGIRERGRGGVEFALRSIGVNANNEHV